MFVVVYSSEPYPAKNVYSRVTCCVYTPKGESFCERIGYRSPWRYEFIMPSPQTSAGTYRVKVDAEDVWAESNEENNEATVFYGGEMSTATSGVDRANRANPGDLKLPEVGLELRDPNRGPQDPGKFRPDWQPGPTTPLPYGFDENNLTPGKGDPRNDDELPEAVPSDGGSGRSGAFSQWIPGETTPDGTPLWSDDEQRENYPTNPPPQDDEELVPWNDKYTRGDLEGPANVTYAEPVEPGNAPAPWTEEEAAIVTEEEYEKMMQQLEDEGIDDPVDPLEDLRSSVIDRGLSQGDGTGERGDGSGGVTGPERPTGEGWLRHKMGIQGRGGVDPEGEGGPDEMHDVAAAGGVNRDQATADGSTASPSVDDKGGTGPGIPLPNAVQSEASTGSGAQTSMGASGTTHSAGKPAVGDEGGTGPGIPLPNADQSEIGR